MEKRNLRIITVGVFAGLLTLEALQGANTGRGELGEIQMSMWNLGRVDNFQMTYEYLWKQGGTVNGERMNAWMDMLTGNWTSEHYATDEDGTRLYLKQFCDGKRVYHYIDWCGEWEQLTDVERGDTIVPEYDMITELGYDGTDVEEVERTEQGGTVEITCYFTPEYREEAWEKQVAQVEKSYAFYEKSGAGEDAVRSAELAVEQYRQARYEDMTATYVIDENQILHSIGYEITLIMPETTQDLLGNKMLGKERKMQITLEVQIDRYDQGGIANKVEQYRAMAQADME